MKIDKYYLGLDMGTNSVGWAATDKNYNLLRIKGKDAWGIRKFDEAVSAVERRNNRVSRRRRQREQVRIGILKSLFADAISEIDPYFLLRLENSKYYYEDKATEVLSSNGLFDDVDFSDKEYYAKYPTIFHLRKALIDNEDAPYDIRLVFLAILNMFKHRGHFLNSSLGDNGMVSITDVYSQFTAYAEENYGMVFPVEKATEVEEILSDKGSSRSVKAEKLFDLFGVKKSNKDQKCLVIRALCGLKVDAKKIFEDIETEEKCDIDFSDFGYDEKSVELAERIGDENFEFVEIMKAVHDAGKLSAILKNQKSLSHARVNEYEKHHKDLELLKKVYKNNLPASKYDNMFRSDNDGTYSAYVGSVNSDDYRGKETKKLRRDMGKRSRDDLYSTIKKDIEKITGEEADYIRDQIEKELFLPKQLTAGNGIIPNQVHKAEMKIILGNAEEYLPFLKSIDETGKTITEKILALFSFQVPYYVGPVSENSAKNGGNGWVVRKEEGQVLPWNIDEKIDDAETRKNFIHRLIRDCTYIDGATILLS